MKNARHVPLCHLPTKQFVVHTYVVCLDGNIQTISKIIWIISYLKGAQHCTHKQFVEQNLVLLDDHVQSNLSLISYLICVMFVFGCNIKLIAFAT